MPGAQAIARAARLLRLVTAAGEAGAGVQELARQADLSRSTAHRLLSALRVEGLVDQDENTARWMPGPELFLMGSVAATRYDVTGLARDIVRSLAVKTEESAFLSVRRRMRPCACSARRAASRSAPSCSARACGSRSGSHRRASRSSRSCPRRMSRPTSNGIPSCRSASGARTPRPLRARIADTRDRGYAVNPGLIVKGSWGLGAAVFNRAGQPEWALSLTGVEFRFGPDRLPALGRTLLAHAHQLTTRIAAAGR